MIPSNSVIIYSDVNSDTPCKSELIYNLDSIQQSIENIIFTKIYEIPFLRSFGSNLEDFLFEPISQSTANEIYSQLITSIERWETRVKINNTRSYVNPDYDNYQYTVSLVYSVLNFENYYYSITGALPQGGFNKLS